MCLAKVHKKQKRACAFTNGGSAQITHGKIKKKSIKIILEGCGVGGGVRGLETVKLHPVPRSNTLRIVPICRRFDCIRCIMRSLVMPHSATIIASGDEISTTISWNSGV